MTAAEPDTGERRRLAVDELVDRLMWWLDGPDGEPPPSIAALPPAQRREAWLHIDRLARESGQAAIRTLLDGLTARNTSPEPTDVDDPSGRTDQ